MSAASNLKKSTGPLMERLVCMWVCDAVMDTFASQGELQLFLTVLDVYAIVFTTA